MKHPLHDIELIEKYFDNDLTEAENNQLKDRLKRDFEFQKLFDQEKLLVSTIRLQAARQDLNYLKQIENSLNENKTSYFRQHWHYFAAAACIALIALVVVRPLSHDSPEELYAAYFTPQPNVFEPTMRGNADQTPRSQAFQAYDQGNYQQASALFTELIKENKEAGMLMLLGNSNLMLEKTAEAKQNFIDLIANYDDLDLEAKWYLSLCYLKGGDTEQARNLLNEIADTDTSYASKADKLLKKLE